jgi:hypothetical protein
MYQYDSLFLISPLVSVTSGERLLIFLEGFHAQQVQFEGHDSGTYHGFALIQGQSFGVPLGTAAFVLTTIDWSDC